MLRHLKNCSLYHQLIIPILIVGIIGVCATVYSAFILEDSVSALGDLYTKGDKKLRIIEEIETDLAYYRALSLKHIASEDSLTMAETHVEIDYIYDNINNNLALISTTHIDTHSIRSDNFLALLATSKEYFKKTDTMVLLSSEFEKESAFEHLSQFEAQFIPEINEAVQQLKRHEFENFSLLRKTLMSAASRNLTLTIAIGIGGGSLTLIIAFIVTRRITRRLSKLLIWSGEISRGNLSASLASDSHDEVGRLTVSMKDMANNIESAHHDLADAKKKAESIADELQIYANAFENSGESIIITDKQNHILNVNAAFTTQTGFTLDEVVDKDPKIFASGQTPIS
ncbi:MAG: MCP four helix bundle domain-containing protein, partial [Gammaproteobacteria bacterium]|nr:MCP four helix bundle domain-containing protein [Gammaproteobacteria bacterium]